VVRLDRITGDQVIVGAPLEDVAGLQNRQGLLTFPLGLGLGLSNTNTAAGCSW
jgi:hypothetical protein